MSPLSLIHPACASRPGRVAGPEVPHGTGTRRRGFAGMIWTSLLVVLVAGCGPSPREQAVEAREQAVLEAERDQDERAELLEARARQISMQEDVLETTRAAMEDQRREFEERAADARAQELELRARQTQLEEQLAGVQRLSDHWEATIRRGLAPDIGAERAIVVNADNGEVLFERNGDEPVPATSAHQLLTALIVAEAGDLEEPVTIAAEDTEVEPVTFGVVEGDVFTKRQLLAILMLRSANDSAQALARLHSGSAPLFKLRMNQRASELGMDNSRFANPHGLPADDDDEQYSTARDLARLAIAADAQPDLRELMAATSFPLTRPDATVIDLENLNGAVALLEHCDGIKAGSSAAAGHCIILSGERRGLRRIVVVLNGGPEQAADDAVALLEWSLNG